MNKIFSVIIVIVMLLCITACNNNHDTNQSNTNQDIISSTEATSNTHKENNENITNNSSSETPPNNSVVGTTPSHTHNFSSATCTSPRTCSCGVTEGSALDHKFTNATCTSAKKCSRCGVSEGAILGHNYRSGKCTRCGNMDPNYPTTIKKTLGDTITFNFENMSGKTGSFTVALGDSYTVKYYDVISNTYDGQYVRIPIQITNNNNYSIKLTHAVSCKFYTSTGSIYASDGIYTNSVISDVYFTDGKHGDEVRANSTINRAIYIPYTGSGTYTIALYSEGYCDISFDFTVT